MVDLSGVDLISWFFFLGFIVVCFIIIIIVTKLEERYNKALVDKKQKKRDMENARGMKGIPSSKGEKQKEFVVGQVYQMEDGTLAKYMEDGKFRKIKEE